MLEIENKRMEEKLKQVKQMMEAEKSRKLEPKQSIS
jgi:hypothetical protein